MKPVEGNVREQGAGPECVICHEPILATGSDPASHVGCCMADLSCDGCSAAQPAPDVAGLPVERDEVGEPRRFWWCPAWGTLNATRFHGNEGPDDPNCGVVSYFRAARSTEEDST